MALGLIQPLTEINIRNVPRRGGGGGVSARPAYKADKLTDICELII
jgi:hypothetical protein